MTNQKLSPILLRLEIRLKQLDDLRTQIGFKKAALDKYQDHVEKLNFLIKELDKDKNFCLDNIVSLIQDARNEGYSEKEIDRLLKDHKIRLDEIKPVD